MILEWIRSEHRELLKGASMLKLRLAEGSDGEELARSAASVGRLLEHVENEDHFLRRVADFKPELAPWVSDARDSEIVIHDLLKEIQMGGPDLRRLAEDLVSAIEGHLEEMRLRLLPKLERELSSEEVSMLEQGLDGEIAAA